MRRPFISGNWKMNLDNESISVLCKTINEARDQTDARKSKIQSGV